MGLLNLFKRTEPASSELVRLPSGSYTVDAAGKVIVSTLPRAFPVEKVREISEVVLRAFKSARAAGLPMGEFILQYSALRLTARELRGGAIIFLAPRALEKR